MNNAVTMKMLHKYVFKDKLVITLGWMSAASTLYLLASSWRTESIILLCESKPNYFVTEKHFVGVHVEVAAYF